MNCKLVEVTKMVRQRLQADIISYSAAISACEKCAKWKTSMEMDVITYCAAISACQKSVALGLFREMRSFKPSIVAANAVISAFGMASEWQRALTQFRSSSYTLKPDVVTYAAVMTALEKAVTACGNAAQWSIAIYLLEEAQARMLQPDVVTHDGALVVKRVKDLPGYEMAATGFLDRADSLSVLTVVTFSAAISACGKSSQWIAALDLFSSMDKRTLEANVITLSSAITACERSLKWPEALVLIADALSTQLKPNTIAYSAALSACSQSWQWGASLALLAYFQRRAVRADVSTMASAIDACEFSAEWRQTPELLRRLNRDASLQIHEFSTKLGVSQN
ncbi:MRL1 [Symbiodinium pilosum]|uniref:MRL1 protein n=1 Tax=Symbiodinium pilosum TaxID=2952 RepID=A0A812NAY1_SYMPI|nr:MRL1 [Symbiodinium pilosum]